MQYFKHTESGQVYGASERTIPPVSFFEKRPQEFTKAPKPAPKPKAPAAGDETPKE